MWLRISDELAHNLALADKITIEPAISTSLDPSKPHPIACEVVAHYGSERRVVWWGDTFLDAVAGQVGIFHLMREGRDVVNSDEVVEVARQWIEKNGAIR